MDNQGLKHITEIEIKLQKAESTIYKLEEKINYLESFTIPNLRDLLNTYTDRDVKQRKKIADLENKLVSIERIARINASYR